MKNTLEELLITVEGFSQYDDTDNETLDNTLQELIYHLDRTSATSAELENKARVANELHVSVCKDGPSRDIMNALHTLYPDVEDGNRPLTLYTVEQSSVCKDIALEDFKETLGKIGTFIVNNYGTIFKIILAILALIGVKLAWNKMTEGPYEEKKDYQPVGDIEKVPEKYPNIPQKLNDIDPKYNVLKASLIDTFYKTVDTKLHELLLSKDCPYKPNELVDSLAIIYKEIDRLILSLNVTLESLTALGKSKKSVDEFRKVMKDLASEYFKDGQDLIVYSYDAFFEEYLIPLKVVKPIVDTESDIYKSRKANNVVRHYSTKADTAVPVSGKVPDISTCGVFWRYEYKSPGGKSPLTPIGEGGAWVSPYASLKAVKAPKIHDSIIIFPDTKCNIPGVFGVGNSPVKELVEGLKKWGGKTSEEGIAKKVEAFKKEIANEGRTPTGYKVNAIYETSSKDGSSVFEVIYPFTSNETAVKQACSDDVITTAAFYHQATLTEKSIFKNTISRITTLSKTAASLAVVITTIKESYDAYFTFEKGYNKLYRMVVEKCEAIAKDS